MRRIGPLLLIGFLSPVALAQNGRDVPSGRPNQGGKLDLPTQTPAQEAKPAETEVTSAAYVSEFWGETKHRTELVFVALEEADAAGEMNEVMLRESLAALESMGLRTRETALKALESPHLPSVSLAARLLESVGDLEKEDARTLVEIASGVGDVGVAGDCVDAALVIQGSLPLRAVDLIAHPRRALRTMAESRLRDHTDVAFVPGLLRHLRAGREPDIRTRSARLLSAYRDLEEARAGLRAALKDESVSVAFTAVEALVGDATEADRAYIRNEIDALDTGKELAYLLYGLLLQQELAGELLVDGELSEKLTPLLGVSDPFLSGVCAAVVAEFVFRSDVEEGLENLQRSLPLALVRAVGGAEFYPQYARFSPYAVQSLRRISGQDFSDQDRRAWAEWYAQNRTNFVLVRGQMKVSPDDLPRLQVTWYTDQADPRSLGGVGAVGLDLLAGGRMLGPQAVERLYALLENTVVLDAQVLPGTYGVPTEPITAGIEVRVAGRRKPIQFRGRSAASWLPALIGGLDALYRAESWQLLAGSARDAEGFLTKSVLAWDEADPGRRGQLLADWHRERALALSPEAFDAWASFLLENPSLCEGWPADTSELFFMRLPQLANDVTVARRITDAALLARTAADTPMVVEALTQLDDPRRTELLTRAFSTLGMASATQALEDSRLYVRVPAVQALAAAGSEAVPTLLGLLEDADPLVIRVALQSLGRIGDPSSLPAVEEMASPGQPRELRKAAVVAMAGFGELASVELLRAAAADEDISMRLSALAALRNVEGQEADLAFGEILPRYVGTNLEPSFSHALEGRGAALARMIYGRYLGDPNPMISRRVALRAGMLGEPAAVPVLMRLMRTAPNDRELLDALAHATCVDYRSMPDPAGIYEIWWRDHQRQDPSLWLVDGLQGRDFELATHFIEGSGATREVIVTDLLDLLLRGPRYLRPAAQLYLTELTGLDAPAISIGLPVEAVEEAALLWRTWLAQS